MPGGMVHGDKQEPVMRLWLRQAFDSEPAGCAVFAFFTEVRHLWWA